MSFMTLVDIIYRCFYLVINYYTSYLFVIIMKKKKNMQKWWQYEEDGETVWERGGNYIFKNFNFFLFFTKI